MKEYFIHLKNITTGEEVKLRKLLTEAQVVISTKLLGKVDKNNIQLVDFWQIK